MPEPVALQKRRKKTPSPNQEGHWQGPPRPWNLANPGEIHKGETRETSETGQGILAETQSAGKLLSPAGGGEITRNQKNERSRSKSEGCAGKKTAAFQTMKATIRHPERTRRRGRRRKKRRRALAIE